MKNKQHLTWRAFLHISSMAFGWLFVFGVISAQENAPRKYDAWIRKTDLKYTIEGYLYQLKDSSVLMGNNHKLTAPPVEYAVENIRYIAVSKKNAVLRGAVWGGILGFGSGFLFGQVLNLNAQYCINNSCSPIPRPSATTRGILWGFVGVLPGTLLGGMIGSTKTTIDINGSFDTYQKQKAKLARYSRY